MRDDGEVRASSGEPASQSLLDKFRRRVIEGLYFEYYA